jgi:valyl-tRNA synthetase
MLSSPMRDLPKTYDAKRIQARWTPEWERSGIFTAGRRPDAKPYTIMIPPPNVTDVLHMGHALNNTIQDVMARWHRMKGHDVLWLPGTDHAGIATQAVVERKLFKERGVTRHDLGREEFLRAVWAWKEESGGTILQQLRLMGFSCDWTRTAFTMDENLSRAVRVSFVRMWQKGLIYRGSRMVNWDCTLQSAVGDDEVIDQETAGHLWYMRYPYEDGSGHVTVATTRPETMLGDTGVAVHPDDERYRDAIGKTVILPLVHRKIPMVADDTVDREFGTGAVKVTPGHDFDDYERGRRHDLPVINILNPDGTLNENAGPYAGLDRMEARKSVVRDLEAQGLLGKIEDYTVRLPLSDRSKSPVEPLVSEQWFVKMTDLAQPAIDAVKSGDLRIVPERWTKVYLEWLLNVRDWCISRQLWWGHQIPVWYDEDDVPVASVEDLEIGSRHPQTGKPIVRRDSDVLDTWASSWLWPFSTLGWPNETADLKRYYPTQFLGTARDIIYLWVARMVMAGYEFCGACPFRDVYIHANILDAQGRKMSKSAGNGIDPRDMIAQYGADAVRFTLMILTTEGQDVRLAETKFELGRNFMNKIWNAARFVLTSVPDEAARARLGDALEDRWILSRTNVAVDEITNSLASYRFHDAAQALYRFVWNDFCDWYVECSKKRLRGGDLACGATLIHVLRHIVRLVQPFAPYIAAELADHLAEDQPAALLEWPRAEPADEEAEAVMARLQAGVSAVRQIRGEYNVLPQVEIPELYVDTRDPGPIEAHRDLFANLSGVADVVVGEDIAIPQPSGTVVVSPDTFAVPLSPEIIDIEGERQRLQRELDKAQGHLRSVEAKLGNENFTSRAKPEVVQRERERADEVRARIARLEAAMADLGG